MPLYTKVDFPWQVAVFGGGDLSQSSKNFFPSVSSSTKQALMSLSSQFAQLQQSSSSYSTSLSESLSSSLTSSYTSLSQMSSNLPALSFPFSQSVPTATTDKDTATQPSNEQDQDATYWGSLRGSVTNAWSSWNK